MTDYLATLSTVFLTWIVTIGCTSTARADEKDRILFDFRSEDAAKQWQPVNDGVMGGVSDGRFRITEQGIMEFFGTLSLENRGGFASVRSRPAALGLKDGDVLFARIRGDGREYYCLSMGGNEALAFRRILQVH